MADTEDSLQIELDDSVIFAAERSGLAKSDPGLKIGSC